MGNTTQLQVKNEDPNPDKKLLAVVLFGHLTSNHLNLVKFVKSKMERHNVFSLLNYEMKDAAIPIL